MPGASNAAFRDTCGVPGEILKMTNPTPHDIAPGSPLITLENVTLRLRDRPFLPKTRWQIRSGENWAVLGPNGAGKTALTGVLVGRTPYSEGRVIRHEGSADIHRIGYLSLELQENWLAAAERAETARSFSNGADEPIRSTDLLHADTGPRHPPPHDLLSLLELEPLMNKELRSLSTGEIRRVLLAGAVMRSERLLVLDEPFEGVDSGAREHFRHIMTGLIRMGRQIVLVTHRFQLLPEAISHVLCLKDGRLVARGPLEKVLSEQPLSRLYEKPGRRSTGAAGRPTGRPSPMPPRDASGPENRRHRANGSPTLEMNDVTVRHGNRCILKNLNWTVRAGEHWGVLGPNGAGKTTLLNLISGDHLQAYANDIFLFGHRRGSGESIWDIKSRIGLVSSEFQFRFNRPFRVRDVVHSGFFDSVGLYRSVTRHQANAAMRWLAFFGMAEKAASVFNRLSYGEKRLVLLARAMVKNPNLLILDEPCQGLDPANRRVIIDLVDTIGMETPTQILYVTHHEYELPSCLTHILALDGSGDSTIIRPRFKSERHAARP